MRLMLLWHWIDSLCRFTEAHLARGEYCMTSVPGDNDHNATWVAISALAAAALLFSAPSEAQNSPLNKSKSS